MILMGLLGVVGGFVGGIIVSEVIAVIGHLLLDDLAVLRGLRYLPFIFAVLGGIVVPLWFGSRKRAG